MAAFPVSRNGLVPYYRAGIRDRSEQFALMDGFEALIDHSADTYSVVDAGGRWTYISAPTKALVPPGTALPVDLVHPEDLSKVEDTFKRVLAGDPPSLTIGFRVRTTGRDWTHCETRFTNLMNHPAVEGILLNSRDVTERVEADETLRRQAYRDSLTGLANRAFLIERLGEALAPRGSEQRDQGEQGERGEQGEKTDRNVTVALLDLDNFKLINDAYGHAVGDDLLRQTAERLTATVGTAATVARLTGDEFALAAEGLDHAAMTALARRVMASVSEPLELATGGQVVVTTSMGIATGRAGGVACEPETLLRNAETALFRAKENGRDISEIFDDELRDRAVQRHQTEQRLRKALELPELGLGYQPIIDLRTGKPTEAEALLRLNVGEPGLSTDEVIGVAEETGLIVPLGAHVLEQVCGQAALWRAEFGRLAPASVAVNISARQLTLPGFAQSVSGLLDTYDLPASCLCLELTETALLDVNRRTAATLHELKDLGVCLAIDDFGTGYSSLTYLKRFPLDLLKIDRSFVHGLGTDPNDTKIVRAVAGLGQALGLTTVAEGVETERQLIGLRALGCDMAQGFYFSPALGRAEFGDMLRRDEPLVATR